MAQYNNKSQNSRVSISPINYTPTIDISLRSLTPTKFFQSNQPSRIIIHTPSPHRKSNGGNIHIYPNEYSGSKIQINKINQYQNSQNESMVQNSMVHVTQNLENTCDKLQQAVQQIDFWRNKCDIFQKLSRYNSKKNQLDEGHKNKNVEGSDLIQQISKLNKNYEILQKNLGDSSSQIQNIYGILQIQTQNNSLNDKNNIINNDQIYETIENMKNSKYLEIQNKILQEKDDQIYELKNRISKNMDMQNKILIEKDNQIYELKKQYEEIQKELKKQKLEKSQIKRPQSYQIPQKIESKDTITLSLMERKIDEIYSQLLQNILQEESQKEIELNNYEDIHLQKLEIIQSKFSQLQVVSKYKINYEKLKYEHEAILLDHQKLKNDSERRSNSQQLQIEKVNKLEQKMNEDYLKDSEVKKKLKYENQKLQTEKKQLIQLKETLEKKIQFQDNEIQNLIQENEIKSQGQVQKTTLRKPDIQEYKQDQNSIIQQFQEYHDEEIRERDDKHNKLLDILQNNKHEIKSLYKEIQQQSEVINQYKTMYYKLKDDNIDSTSYKFKYAKKNLPTFHEGYDVDFNKQKQMLMRQETDDQLDNQYFQEIDSKPFKIENTSFISQSKSDSQISQKSKSDIKFLEN